MLWNKVLYMDCMDPDEGLPSLPDKSIDLCLTDPPWNINFNLVHRTTLAAKASKNKRRQFAYKDKIKDYKSWCKKLYKELDRTCHNIIIAPGRQNLKIWYEISDPIDLFIHFKINGSYGSYVAHFNCFEPYLYYGNKRTFFLRNVFDVYVNSQFLRKRQYKHTSPKSIDLWSKIIIGFNPESIIDPFLGSGTTAEVCTKLGIPWLGYEINEVYSQDINKRLKNCKREPKQIGIEVFK